MFCRSSFVLLAIVLSVLLRYMDSDYPFRIFKLFLIRPAWMEWLYKVRLMRNDVNCLLFRILFQLFYRLNWNSCFSVWDLLCLLVFLSSFFLVLLCILFLSDFVWWVLRCLTGLCCLSLDFLVFILFSFSKQLYILICHLTTTLYDFKVQCFWISSKNRTKLGPD